MKKLAQIHEHLLSIDESLKSQEFVEATKSINSIQELLSEPVNESENEIKILKKLQGHFHAQRDRLINEVETSWSSNVKWTLPKGGGNNKECIVELNIISSNKAKEIIKNVSMSMAELGILHDKLSLFSSRFLTHFVKLMVTKKDLHFTEGSAADCKKLVIKFTKGVESKDILSPTEVFKRLVFFISFP